MVGIATWCRGHGGLQSNYQTYGLGPTESEAIPQIINTISQTEEMISETHCSVAKKAYGFWQHSSITGTSDYLNRKGVGSYGIRFRQSEQYGNTAVIPMYNSDGRLWNYQLLNADGSKRDAKGGRTNGLFHSLRPLLNKQPIGIAESYVTSATCMELTDIPVVCAFSCHNLKSVAMAIRQLYPNSSLIIFADNDRHLNQNQGLLKAQEACDSIKTRIIMSAPDFGDLEPSKEASDWNDLVRLKGTDFAKLQISLVK